MGAPLPTKLLLRPPAAGALRRDSAALHLLQIESELRGCASEAELLQHLVNRLQPLLAHAQAFVLRRQRGSGWRVEAATGLPSITPEAPLVRALESMIARRIAAGELVATHSFGLPGDALEGYPHAHALWTPLRERDGGIGAGLLLAAEAPFDEAAHTLAARVAETAAHAWRALRPRGVLRARFGLGRRGAWALAAGLLALACWPVRLSVMAPVEVVALEPFVVTAPIAGVVKSIAVAPNAPVQAGQVLVQFDDIQPRNEMVLAQQRLAVAAARDARTGAAAFKDASAAHELAIARAEYELADVNFRYAREVYERTRVLAPRAGIAVYSDRRDWEGRPVAVGEQILQVADPARVAYRIDLAAGNTIALERGAEVGVYLDSAPLGGLAARLDSQSYKPRVLPSGELAYAISASVADGALPRIGARGTAQLYGSTVPLAYQLLRRPIAALRQAVGW